MNECMHAPNVPEAKWCELATGQSSDKSPGKSVPKTGDHHRSAAGRALGWFGRRAFDKARYRGFGIITVWMTRLVRS